MWTTDELAELVERAGSVVMGHLSTVAQGRVAASGAVGAGVIRAWLESGYDFEEPLGAAGVLDDVADGLRRWSVHTTHPGYFGLFNPAPTGPGIAGELLAAGFNPQLAAWSHAPAAVEMELHVVRFLARRLGLAPHSGGSITTGGAEANLTAVLLGLMRSFPEYGQVGLRGIEAQPVFYASGESHLAWMKIAHVVGLGREALRLVPVQDDLRMDLDHLSHLIDADRAAGYRPFLVAATAGTTGVGVIDPLPGLAELARAENLWLHTDAAWAGALALSDQLRPLLAGIENSDSVTLDAHKWLSVPMGAGVLLTPHHQLLAEVFAVSTSYMPAEAEDAADPYTTSLQWSRRFAGLKVFLALAMHGRRGYATQLEHDVDLAATLSRQLTADGWEQINQTPLPVVCVRDPASTELSLQQSWDWHAAIAEHVVAGGTSWISPVRLNGKPALRACITNYRSTEHDTTLLVTALNAARRARRLGE